MSYNVDTLVFSGGGVHGFTFIGAIKAVKKQNYEIKNFIGTSAGALCAFSLACKINPEIFEKLLINSNSNDFIDNEWKIMIPYRFINEYGCYTGKNLEEWIKNYVKTLSGILNPTFAQIKEHFDSELIITGVCLDNNSLEIFSSKTTPDMSVIDALIISTRIPLLFEPYLYNDKLYVDGGVLNQFPIDVALEFSKPENILGIHIVGDNRNSDNQRLIKENLKEKNFNQISSCFEFCLSLLKTLLSNGNSHGKFLNFIEISYDKISFIDFNINLEDKNKMIEHGYNVTEDYFENNKLQPLF